MLKNKKKLLHPLPLILITVVVGIISFLLISFLAPFKGGFFALLFPKPASHAASATDWNQIGKDPQHTGFSSEILGTNFKVKWTHPFQPEKVSAQVQAIVYSGIVFIPTQSGNVYALDAITGAQKWKFSLGSPILNSVAVDNGLVYTAALNGAVYGINATTGAQVWKTQLSSRLGFSTAPILADNKVLIGGREGYFYALDPVNGNLLWRYKASGPILMSAAYDQGKVFFGTMDMYMYALDSASGSFIWKSPKIAGIALKDYYPVVYQGKVFVHPWGLNYEGGIFPLALFHRWSGAIIPGSNLQDMEWLANNSATIASGNAMQVPEFVNNQNTTLADLASNPAKYTTYLHILDENTGQIALSTINMDTQTLDGPVAPPCVDKDGKLIVPVMFIESGWGRLDLAQRKIVDVLYDGNDYAGNPLLFNGATRPTNFGIGPAGFGNDDETLNVTCTGNLILSFHTVEENANYTGFFDLVSRKWRLVPSGWTNGQMGVNNQGGEGNAPTVSNGMVYHVVLHELVARTTN